MVVEDEKLLLDAIGIKLDKENIRNVLCSSGEEAISYLKTAQVLPKAIWLDYYLKDMNGLTFIGKLKEDPRCKDIPIIVVSNSASSEKVHSMLALGAKKYLLKSEYRLEDIVGIIKDLISS